MKIALFGNGTKNYSTLDTKIFYQTMNEIIEQSNKLEIYIGYQGNFDRMCYHYLSNHKDRKNYKLFLVIPYLNINLSQEFKQTFDDIIYPPLETCPYKAKILQRNYWMVNISDKCIFYVDYPWGGSGKTLQYAIKKKKEYINLGAYEF